MKRRELLALGGAALVGAQSRIVRAQGGTSKKILVGFGSRPVNDTFKNQYPVHDDLEAIALYTSAGDRKCVLVAFDFGDLSYDINTKVRRGIAQKTGLPLEYIILHCTHNHSGPMNEDYRAIDLAPLINRAAEAVQAAQQSARPAELARVAVNVGHRFSINRRMFIDGDLGTQTFWYGYNYPDERGTVDARRLLNERLTRWFGEVPEKYRTDAPLINQGPVDELLQLLVFRDAESKKTLGSLLRFAAHVQLAVCASKWLYSSCVPGYARRRLREVIGGDAIFVNGPCGNLVAKEFMKFKIDPGKFNWAETPLGPSGQLSSVDDAHTWHIVEREGRALADKVIAAFNKDLFVPLSRFEAAWSKEYMPLRESIPHEKGGYEEAKKKTMDAYKAALAAKAPVITIKKLAEEYNHAHWMKAIIELWYDLTDEDLKKRTAPYELQAFSLNDVVLVALPGEVVKDTNDYLRANTRGDRLITMTECNADLGYLATREMFPFGSYEVNCGLNDISGEQKLREAARELILRV